MVRTKIACIFSLLIAFFASLVPLNYIVGSKFALLSLSCMALPAVGAYYSLLYVILYICTKSLLVKSFSYLFFLHKIPLLCSTLAFRGVHATSYVALPVCATLLFSMHPVGRQVWYYCWLWIIPMIIYWSGNQSIIARACGASVIAHACGSVVWLYTANIPAEIWAALLPIVPIERFFIAVGMVGFVSLFDLLYQAVTQQELV